MLSCGIVGVVSYNFVSSVMHTVEVVIISSLYVSPCGVGC